MDETKRGAGMSRTNPVIYLGVLLAMLVVLGGAGLGRGELLVAKHEGDMLHFVDIVMRMAQGQRPHLDFSTPIGAWAFAPVVLFVKWGFGVGTAFLAAQVLVALCLLPAVWWVGVSRLTPGLSVLFGLIVMGMVLALVHGEAQPDLSLSMHYNRWAWAISFVAILIAVLPAIHPKSPLVDGIVLGVAMVALVMLKITYPVAFALPVALALVLSGQRRALALAVLVGLALMALLTLAHGGHYWVAYLHDLQDVAASELRSRPSASLGGVLVAPPFLGATAAGVAGVVFLRQARAATAGLILLLLLPGFVFVTYQNFGNDPQWLLVLALILLASRPVGDIKNGLGWPMRAVLTTTAAVTLALAAPSFLNMLNSPFQHLTLPGQGYAPMIPHSGANEDLLGQIERVITADARVPLDGEGSAFAAFASLSTRPAPAVLKGEVLPECRLDNGISAMHSAVVADMAAAGLTGGRKVFAADLLNAYWLFGDLAPLAGNAPWYYRGLGGLEDADYVLVPLCPLSPPGRALILRALQERGTDDLTEIRRTDLYILLAKG